MTSEEILEQTERLGIGMPKPDPDELDSIFAEAQGSTDRPVHHYLRDAKTDAGLRELAIALLIDVVVDASKSGGRAREMLYGISRFEHANAPGNAFQGRVPPAWRRFGASVFLDEASGAVYAFVDASVHLDEAQIATLVSDQPDAVRSYQHAQELTGFQRSSARKVADSLAAFLASCAPCTSSMPENDDYPKYE